MKYLSITILSCAALFFCSCDEKPGSDDTRHTTNYIYTNETGASLALDYHYSVEENGIAVAKTKTENIAAGKSITETMVIPGAKTLILIDCDSLRIVFNEAKELWYYRTKETDKKGNPFLTENYAITPKSETETDCNYKFDQEVFELASEIK